MFRYMILSIISSSIAIISLPVLASDVEIVAVEATKRGEKFNFDVTLKHADTGWDHYANIWRVETEDGTVLGTRELAHPHVSEQPFTRSLSGVKIPDGTMKIVIRAGDNIGGMTSGGKVVILPK